MRARARRLWLFVIAGTILVSAAGLTIYALSSQLDYYIPPAKIASLNGEHIGKRARIGGVVKFGSLKTHEDGMIEFVVEDPEAAITVRFDGITPDLFREGQGVICTGTFTQEYTFEAREVLARHDENYIPKELEEQMKKDGVYRGS